MLCFPSDLKCDDVFGFMKTCVWWTCFQGASWEYSRWFLERCNREFALQYCCIRLRAVQAIRVWECTWSAAVRDQLW